MNSSTHSLELQAQIQSGANDLFLRQENDLHRRIDRMFAGLMIFQWLAGILWAFLISPQTWAGTASSVHIHVLAAIIVGGALAAFPVFLAYTRPGELSTRYTIAVCQMLTSALLIHLSGGRIETHFHVFGSLAFLAFYRDWKVLVTATAVTAIDHFARGLFYPQSVYGILLPSNWRWVEHAAWVLFEDVFLIYSCVHGRRELYEGCQRRSELENVNESIERLVQDRTKELEESHSIIRQRTKLAALGEMAGSLAHEIRNPLAIIQGRARNIVRQIERDPSQVQSINEFAQKIVDTGERIEKIMKGLYSFSRNGEEDEYTITPVAPVIEETLVLCSERFKNGNVEIIVESLPEVPRISCSPVQIQQVLLNLMNNAYDAIEKNEEKWVRVSAEEKGDFVEIYVTDSGKGIPPEIQEKLSQSFFTTKGSGKGVGLGLSISKTIVEKHGGKFFYEPNCPNTRFVLRLPKYLGTQILQQEAA